MILRVVLLDSHRILFYLPLRIFFITILGLATMSFRFKGYIQGPQPQRLDTFFPNLNIILNGQICRVLVSLGRPFNAWISCLYLGA